MKAATKLSVHRELKEISELNEALLCEGGAFLIAKDISLMFTRDNDKSLDELGRIQNAAGRFNLARELYQNIWNDGRSKTPFAIFYKLEDYEKMQLKYFSILREIMSDFKQWLINDLKEIPKFEQINHFFSNQLQKYKKEIAENLNGQIKHDITEYLISSKAANKLQTRETKMIHDHFDAEKANIKKLFQARFFQVSNYSEVVQAGCIYTPGPILHNWGVNACWTLAVTRSGLPIKVLSDIKLENLERRQPNESYILNPSAFSLEIAIAILMGYGLNITEGKINLIPPMILNNYRTNGQPGNGPLPTKEMQVTIFHRCIYAMNLHRLLPTNSNNPKTADELCQQIMKVCTQWKSEEQYNFTYGLCYLQRGSSLSPILEKLDLKVLEELKKFLESVNFLDKTFDDVKVAVNGELLSNQLSLLANENKSELEKLINEMCAAQDIMKLRFFIEGMNILCWRGIVSPILKMISINNLHRLTLTLFDSIFESEDYTKLHENVQEQYKKNFEEWLHSACTGKNETEQRKIIDHLIKLQAIEQSNEILSLLTLESLEILFNMLRDSQSEDTHYNLLCITVQVHYYTANLNANRQNSTVLDNWINQVCTEKDNPSKYSLAEALLFLNEPIRLLTLNTLSITVIEKLKIMLLDEMFTNDRYQPLKTALTRRSPSAVTQPTTKPVQIIFSMAQTVAATSTNNANQSTHSTTHMKHRRHL